MIYKFIDNNGSEISVNSLSSLQALVDSETIKENTKVKAGLRGKWTTAAEIEDLVFASEKIVEDEKIEEPEGDIKSFITGTDNTEEILEEEVAQEEKIDETQKEFNASISGIGANVDAVSQTIQLKGTITDVSPALLPGMSGRVIF